MTEFAFWKIIYDWLKENGVMGTRLYGSVER